MRKYDHVLSLVTDKVWAVLPSTLLVIRGLVAERSQGIRLSDEEVSERLAMAAAAGDRRGQQQSASVAVVPLYGVIMPKASLMTEMSGGTSVQGFLSMFRSALADTEVSAIILDVDSPGGLTDLVPEAAAEIRAARGQKPIVAVANTLMASAAYWLASQADEIVASPSALVGSIGVYTAHDDLSAAYEAAGIKTTLISAGKFKTEGNDLGPLDVDAQRHIQSLVDDAYTMFTNDVAKGRGVKAAAVRDGYGQGRVLTATMAKSEGLVDRVGTLNETIGRMLKTARAGRGALAAIDDWGSKIGAAWVEGIADSVHSSQIDSDATIIVAPPEPEPEPDPRYAFDKERFARGR